MDKKSYDNGTDFSFVEQKVREVQTTIENAVKTSNYLELNQSITKMVNNTLKQYQKEHPHACQCTNQRHCCRSDTAVTYYSLQNLHCQKSYCHTSGKKPTEYNQQYIFYLFASGISVQEVLDKGEAYIQKIHASNDAIPGEEISAKIARMEQIVEQIFQRAEEHPEIIPDLKKMMDYYLPMTVKLLD